MNRAFLVGCFGVAVLLAGCNSHSGQLSGNANVPKPVRAVDLDQYMGRWYELARYEASFQKGCEGVTADYARRADGKVHVLNTCREGSPTGPSRSSTATARVVDGTSGTMLKVAFFPPIEGDYWVLDHDPRYAWSIVGEPSGKYLWILSRTPNVSERQYQALVQRARVMGYDASRLRRTRH